MNNVKKGLFFLLSLFTIMMFTNINKINAANNNIIDSVTIMNDSGTSEGSFNVDDTMTVKYQWSLKGQKKGDIIKIQLPNEFKVANELNFDLIPDNDPNASVVGKVHVDTQGEITIELTDENNFIATHSLVKGTLNVTTIFNKNLISGPGEYHPIFDTAKGNVDVPVIVKPNEHVDKNELIYKWSTGVDATHDKVEWVVRVNAAKKNLTNVDIVEQLGLGQELIPETVTIYENNNPNNNNFDSMKDVTVEFKDSLICRKDGFDWHVNNINNCYLIKFQAKITDEKIATISNDATIDGDEISKHKTHQEYDLTTGTGTISGINNIAIPVKKIWDGPKQNNVTVILKADGVAINQIELNDANGWQYEFTNLAKYDEYGDIIKYEIEEIPITGYKTIIQQGDSGFVIINKYIGINEFPSSIETDSKESNNSTNMEKIQPENHFKISKNQILKNNNLSILIKSNHSIKREKVQSTNIVDTGDNSNILIYFLLIMISIFSMYFSNNLVNKYN